MGLLRPETPFFKPNPRGPPSGWRAAVGTVDGLVPASVFPEFGRQWQGGGKKEGRKTILVCRPPRSMLRRRICFHGSIGAEGIT
jgi:hypothetical protein